MVRSKLLKALIIPLVCLLLFSSCSGGVVCRVGDGVSGTATDAFLGTADFSDVITVSGGDTKLIYDKKTTAIRVESEEYSWQSLPKPSSEAGTVFYLKVISGEKTYYVNSQSNAVANGAVKYGSDKNSITVQYDVTCSGADFSISLDITYTVSSDRLYVSTDVSRWSITGDAVVADFCLLPYFGAVSYESAGLDLESDYFCVPDGVGALVYTKKSEAPSSVLAYDVYSDNVIAPVFAVKQEYSAFACVTVKGDASMQIVCNTSENLKRIYNLYKLAVCEDGKNYIRAYDGEITAVYSFASGRRLSFADVAGVARSVFMEYGFFDRNEDIDRTTVILDNAQSSESVYASQAQTFLDLAKGKGINNVNLICRGVFCEDGGVTSPEIDEDFGGKEGLTDLCTNAMLKGYKVYASAFLRTKDGKSGTLKNENGDRSEIITFDGEERSFVTTKKITDIYEKFFLSSAVTDCGIYIEDASATLFSAQNYKNCSAGEQYSAIARSCENLGEKYGIMSYGGYFMSLKNSGGTVNIPLTCFATVNSAYVCEPFIPAILHGYVLYTSSPVNLEEIPQLAILKAIEYGCGACVEWSISENNANYYENGLKDSFDYLVTYNEALSGIRGAEITDHYALSDEVYCTEYDGKTHVYVNYSNVSAILGDIVIPPYDILVLN